MRFKDWKSESVHHAAHAEALRKQGERTYVIRAGRESVAMGWMSSNGMKRGEIFALVDAHYGGDTGFGLRLRSTYGDLHDLAVLTDTEFDRIKIIRLEVQLWIDGNYNELPHNMAWEAHERPVEDRS
jgi:hypothetical protein